MDDDEALWARIAARGGRPLRLPRVGPNSRTAATASFVVVAVTPDAVRIARRLRGATLQEDIPCRHVATADACLCRGEPVTAARLYRTYAVPRVPAGCVAAIFQALRAGD